VCACVLVTTGEQESDLVVIEVHDIGPIAEAYPALHMRLGEFHSKRHAKEQQRLAKMLEAKAKELGVSPDSALMVKIKERAEALIEKSKLGAGTAEVLAALKIQRIYRGMRYRKELRRQRESKMVEDGLDLEQEAEKLLRRFSSQATIAVTEGRAQRAHGTGTMNTTEGQYGDEDKPISEVAKSSWRRLQKSRAEFQKQYREKLEKVAIQPTPAEMVAKLDAVVRTTSQLEDKLVRAMSTHIQEHLDAVQQRNAVEMAALRETLQEAATAAAAAAAAASTHVTAAEAATVESDVRDSARGPGPRVSPVAMPAHGGAGGTAGLDAAATEWLQLCGLEELAGVLGTVGSTLSDLAMLTAEDVDALQLKTLTRRRLRGQLSQLEGSMCVAAPSAAVEGQQLRAAIEQQLASLGSDIA
jgi:hypothetical protein